MATTVNEYEPKTYRKESDATDTIVKQRAYVMGLGWTLSSANLEVGDGLPDDSNFHITASHIETDKKLGTRFAVVTAVQYQTGP